LMQKDSLDAAPACGGMTHEHLAMNPAFWRGHLHLR
jgi:hypothetical protein